MDGNFSQVSVSIYKLINMEIKTQISDIFQKLEGMMTSFENDMSARIGDEFSRVDACQELVLMVREKHRKQALQSGIDLVRVEEMHDKLKVEYKLVKDELEKIHERHLDQVNWLAQLWPEGSVLPSLLQPLVKDTLEEKSDEIARLEDRKKRREVGEEAQRNIEERQHWNELTDEYGQRYYYNNSTGESSWKEPSCMAYVVPEGWDTQFHCWKDNWGPDGMDVAEDEEYSDEEYNPVASALKIAERDYSSIEEEEKYADKERDSEDDGEEEFSATQLREQMEQILQDEATYLAQLEECRETQKGLAQQILDATKEEYNVEADRLEEERLKSEEEERVKAEARRKSILLAKIEASTNKQRKKRSGGKGQPIPEVAEEDVAEEPTVPEVVVPEMHRQLVLPLTNITQVRYRELDDTQLEKYKDLEEAHAKTEELENTIRETHESLQGKLVKGIAWLESKQTVAIVDQATCSSKIMFRQKALRKLKRKLLQPPELPEYQDIDKFDPFQALQEPIDTVSQENVPKEAKDDVPSQKLPVKARRGSVVEATPIEKNLNQNRRFSTGSPARVAASPENFQPFKVDIPSNSDELEWDEVDELEDLDDNPGDDEEAARALETLSKDEIVFRDEVRDWYRSRVTYRPKLKVATKHVDKDELSKYNAMPPQHPEKIEFLKEALHQEKARRVYELQCFNADLEQWYRDDNLRTKFEALTESDLQTLSKLADKASKDQVFYENEIPFMKLVAECESEKGTKIWELQTETRVEKVKKSIARTAGEEAVLRVTKLLQDLNDRLEQAKRIPLQALNPIDQLVLEKRAKQECEALQEEIISAKQALLTEHKKCKELIRNDEESTRYHFERLHEEHERQDEVLALFVQHDEILSNIQEMREKLDSNSVDDDMIDDMWSTYYIQVESLSKIRSFMLLLYNRENRWRERLTNIATKLPEQKDYQTTWLAEDERARLQEFIEALSQEHSHTTAQLERNIQDTLEQKKDLEMQVLKLEQELQSANEMHMTSGEKIQDTSLVMINHLQKTMKKQEEQCLELQQKSDAEIQSLIQEHSAVRQTMHDQLEKANEVAEIRAQWISSLRTELSDQTMANEQLLKSYKALEKRRADECTELKIRLGNLLKKCNTLQMWNDSVMLQMQECKEALIAKDEEIKLLCEDHKREQRVIRFELWRHRITAQTILSSPNDLFLFFVQGIAKLAGASKSNNDDLRNNSALEVLAALCKSPRFEIVRLAAKALGDVSWNHEMVPRLFGWRVKKDWFTWVDAKASQELEALKVRNLEFDSIPEVQETDLPNMMADGHEQHPSISNHIKCRQKWAVRSTKPTETPNDENQDLLGQSKHVLATLVELCYFDDWEVKRRAVSSLALTSISLKNSAIMGRINRLVDTLVLMLESEDQELKTNAATAIGNLAFSNPINQDRLLSVGTVEPLLHLCEGTDVDCIHSCVAALANLCSKNEKVSIHVGHADGIYILANLCHSNRIVNVTHASLTEEIQSSASEALVNIMEANDEANIQIIHEKGLAPFVSMCGSKNMIVRRHGALVIGNMAQNDAIRQTIGDIGGIDALFSLANRKDEESRINAMWALQNLSWNRTNQDRIGVQIRQLIYLCLDLGMTDWRQVQENALGVLANILFYNQENRTRVAQGAGWIRKLLALCNEEVLELPALQHVTRAVAALAYCTTCSKVLASLKGIEVFVGLLQHLNDVVQLNAIHALANQSVLMENREFIVAAGGIEKLVNLGGSDNSEIRNDANKVLDILADLPQMNELEAKKEKYGGKGLMEMCATAEDSVVGLAAEAMSEAFFEDDHFKKPKAGDTSVEALLEICRTRTNKAALLPALWALRNAAHNRKFIQDKIGRLKGVQILISVCTIKKEDHELLEGALAALVNVVIDHEKNSRQVLYTALDFLIELADGHNRRENTNAQIAANILKLIGPHNWIICQHCGKKEYGGSRCSNCGYSISFAV